MRLACILAVLTIATLHVTSTALPVAFNTITESRALPDVAASITADGRRHLRRVEVDEANKTEERSWKLPSVLNLDAIALKMTKLLNRYKNWKIRRKNKKLMELARLEV